MKIALVHDYLVQYGGAERVLEAFTELYPYAPIYTLIYDKEAMHGVFEGKRIYTSFLQRMPFSRKRSDVAGPMATIRSADRLLASPRESKRALKKVSTALTLVNTACV